MDRCVTGKRCYPTVEIAEDALLEAWSRFAFTEGEGPVAIYQCEECGMFHFTSRGRMNERLAKAIKEGRIDREREARKWEDRLKRR